MPGEPEELRLSSNTRFTLILNGTIQKKKNQKGFGEIAEALSTCIRRKPRSHQMGRVAPRNTV